MNFNTFLWHIDLKNNLKTISDKNLQLLLIAYPPVGTA